MGRRHYIEPPFNPNRSYEVVWGETKAPPARSFEDRYASTQAYIEYIRARCMQLARVLKKTGSFDDHCDWHTTHYVNVMLDRENTRSILFSESKDESKSSRTFSE